MGPYADIHTLYRRLGDRRCGLGLYLKCGVFGLELDRLRGRFDDVLVGLNLEIDFKRPLKSLNESLPT